MRVFSFFTIISVLAVLFALASTSEAASTNKNLQLNQLWETTLNTTTALDIHLSIWIDPQAAAFKYQGHDLLAITTADGALNMLNASNGATLWSRTTFPAGTVADLQNRACGGNEHGLFIFQAGGVIAINPLTSATKWFIVAAPLGFNTSNTQMYLYNDAIILSDSSSIASISVRNGKLIWSKIGECANGCGYRVDTVSNSGRVAFFENSATNQGAFTAVVYDKYGVLKLQKSFDASWSQNLYLASVDSFTVTVINLQSPLIVYRYPLFTITNFTNPNEEWATGYSLSCPQGGQSCEGDSSYDNKNGYTSFFINTNFRTYSFNFTSGATNGYSYLHENLQGHLVAMAQKISITEQLGADSKLIAFDWKSMQPAYNATLTNVQAYDIRLNWYNEVFAPASQGFEFLFGVEGVVDATFANSYPAGIVKHNIIVEKDRFFFSSGAKVAAFSFTPSTYSPKQ